MHTVQAYSLVKCRRLLNWKHTTFVEISQCLHFPKITNRKPPVPSQTAHRSQQRKNQVAHDEQSQEWAWWIPEQSACSGSSRNNRKKGEFLDQQSRPIEERRGRPNNLGRRSKNPEKTVQSGQYWGKRRNKRSDSQLLRTAHQSEQSCGVKTKAQKEWSDKSPVYKRPIALQQITSRSGKVWDSKKL